ncbi:MAG: prepilin-type N-terminal cleavage/methylation domain-containing protein [Deltaproteobacteria bacterium]|nr:prepilin-type N-terminal cleavage/methylation domain-containing protein [Deltaproteobacteria bacterium]
MKTPRSSALRKTVRVTQQARPGFTIIEVMVAMGLTSVVAVGLYTLSMVASQTFQQQQRVSEMQLRLRSAMELLRSDLQRAGYGSTPNSAVDPAVCPRPAVVLQAVSVARESPNPTILPGDNRFVDPMRLTLVGNFASTDEYKIGAVNANRLSIQHRWDEWERVRSAEDMNRLFPPGRIVRVRGLDGNMQFGTVRSTTFRDARQPIGTMPTIDLEQPLAVTNGTTMGCGYSSTTGWIAPVSIVEYRIANVAAQQPNAYVGSPAFVANKTDLVRREYRIVGGALAAIPNSETIVAEYAVDLAIGASFDEGLTITNEPRIVRYDFNHATVLQRLGPPTAGTSQAHRARSIVFRLSVRDRMQDPEFAWSQRASALLPLTRFRLDAVLPGAARVRTATSEVALVNVAPRNLR